MFSSQLCLNTMFIKMFGSNWFKKNLLLNKGFDTSMNKICCSSVNSRQHSGTLEL